jgi:DNA-binding NtrC family response regulator
VSREPKESPVVLVVDDEPLIRWSVRTHLARAGHRVELAETGREALARLRDDIGVVVLDVRLPDADGLDVLSEIKRRQAGCGVIVMTAYGGPALADEALGRGALCVLNKPFDLERLAAAVGEALTGGRALPRDAPS